MAWKLIDVRVNPLNNAEHREFICDTNADFADLPKGNPGDAAVSAETCDVCVVNASGEWVKFGGGAGSKWVFNDEITIPEEFWGNSYYFNYSLMPQEGKWVADTISFWDDGSGFSYYYGDESVAEEAYIVGDGWGNEMCKTITITEMPEDETFIAWLKANATKSIA